VVNPPALKAATTPPKAAATKPAATKPVPASAQRVAAVRAIVKPATGDAADDEYSYGFRLWEAKFYPESQQQLKMYLDKYPRHSRVSFARNLLGRAFLDDGKADEAARWFLANYQASKSGDRAPDSLLFLAETMRLRKDTNRACVALAQFVDDYPREAVGRLKTQYDATRAGVKCN
jgi:TolA-binding protein